MQAFISTQQGAVFKYVRSGAPSAVPWRILGLAGNRWDLVGRMQKRPSGSECSCGVEVLRLVSLCAMPF